MPIKRNYSRQLPHLIPQGVPIFLTWNLKGAMPQTAMKSLHQERRRLEEQPSRPGETTADRKLREHKILFAIADRFLDRAVAGPMHLAHPPAAEIVENLTLSGASKQHELFAWCVMSNHVHVLLTPRVELKDVTQAIKGYAAFKINGMQNARGRAFWQDESYDHWVLDEEELFRIIHYIENNPVAAGLCERPEDWPRSSARFRPAWQPGDAYKK